MKQKPNDILREFVESVSDEICDMAIEPTDHILYSSSTITGFWGANLKVDASSASNRIGIGRGLVNSLDFVSDADKEAILEEEGRDILRDVSSWASENGIKPPVSVGDIQRMYNRLSPEQQWELDAFMGNVEVAWFPVEISAETAGDGMAKLSITAGDSGEYTLLDEDVPLSDVESKTQAYLDTIREAFGLEEGPKPA